MKVIDVRNVNHALPEAVYRLRNEGVESDSRNGPVLKFSAPVTTVYSKPQERVLFYPERDANPFFHLFESLWMLSGRDDTDYVCRFVKRMSSFSDNGSTLHGAYGNRWINWFGFDQLDVVVKNLRENPYSRRELVSMWSAPDDLGKDGNDLPCNLQALFQVGESGLDMMVTNRSNDLVWGAYGANAVHFSMLHEYVASSIGLDVGKYYQVSFNLHAYKDVLEGPVSALGDRADDPMSIPSACPYGSGEVEYYPLMNVSKDEWDRNLQEFMAEEGKGSYTEPFFRDVAVPMILAHDMFKAGAGASKYKAAIDMANKCKASDWRVAAVEWLQRRYDRFLARKARAEDDGVFYE